MWNISPDAGHQVHKATEDYDRETAAVLHRHANNNNYTAFRAYCIFHFLHFHSYQPGVGLH